MAFGQLSCAVLRRSPPGRYQVHEPLAYAQVKRVGFLVIRTPLAPVRSTGHTGLAQPEPEVDVADDVVLTEDEVVTVVVVVAADL
jgi:hypothetical protein